MGRWELNACATIVVFPLLFHKAYKQNNYFLYVLNIIVSFSWDPQKVND